MEDGDGLILVSDVFGVVSEVDEVRNGERKPLYLKSTS